MSTPAPTRSRRELAIAVALCVTGAALLLTSAGRPWVAAVVGEPGLPQARLSLTGRELAPAVAGLGLLGLAAGPALLATRRLGRRLVGALLALAGVATLVVTVTAAARLESAARAGAPGVAPSDVGVSGWPAVALLGAACMVAAGGLTLLRGTDWPGMGRRYDAPTSRVVISAPPAVGTEHLWRALDRGEDPTG